MRIIIASVISILCGAIFFFAVPGGGILELDLQSVLFSLFFGVISTLPFFLFCTLPTAFIIESLMPKFRLKFRFRLLLYIILTAIFIILYRFTIFYWLDFAESNLVAVFGYGISCSLGFCLSYALFKRRRKRQPEPEEPRNTRRYRSSS
jgi:hypothetical protein